MIQIIILFGKLKKDGEGGFKCHVLTIYKFQETWKVSEASDPPRFTSENDKQWNNCIWKWIKRASFGHVNHYSITYVKAKQPCKCCDNMFSTYYNESFIREHQSQLALVNCILRVSSLYIQLIFWILLLHLCGAVRFMVDLQASKSWSTSIKAGLHYILEMARLITRALLTWSHSVCMALAGVS